MVDLRSTQVLFFFPLCSLPARSLSLDDMERTRLYSAVLGQNLQPYHIAREDEKDCASAVTGGLSEVYAHNNTFTFGSGRLQRLWLAGFVSELPVVVLRLGVRDAVQSYCTA
jgi:hypothetical protein